MSKRRRFPLYIKRFRIRKHFHHCMQYTKTDLRPCDPAKQTRNMRKKECKKNTQRCLPDIKRPLWHWWEEWHSLRKRREHLLVAAEFVSESRSRIARRWGLKARGTSFCPSHQLVLEVPSQRWPVKNDITLEFSSCNILNQEINSCTWIIK